MVSNERPVIRYTLSPTCGPEIATTSAPESNASVNNTAVYGYASALAASVNRESLQVVNSSKIVGDKKSDEWTIVTSKKRPRNKFFSNKGKATYSYDSNAKFRAAHTHTYLFIFLIYEYVRKLVMMTF